ncbi:putative T6SS immunity periplasmic lipoprotein [Pantoea agglomerans]|uniref:putative T6SS immunity periplasmic lipoprotein n=1 Tax=Enterobacter agglomerans TaxID=549 RepID=UPI001653F7E5|nr:putative T6SS immunity periplasmic lipoprotein [Pantoea agglomerans]
MNILTKTLILIVFLLSGCTLGENLDNRYTKETPVPAHVRNSEVCVSLPIQSDEKVVSALTYNMKNPSEQVIFPADKQPKAGLFCIQPEEIKFENGQTYLIYIEVNKKAGGENKKATRKAYISTFQAVQQGNNLTITPAMKQ